MSIYLGTSKYSGSAGIAGGDASVIASNVTLSTSAQTYITVNNQGKTLQLPSAPPAGWLGSTSSTAATGNHAHGHITSTGAVTQSGVAIGAGDSLLFVDSSNSSLIRKSSVTFPGNELVFLDGTGSFSSAPITSVSYTPTVTSSTSGAYIMGTLTINGSDTTLYGKDTTSSGGGGASYLGDLNDVSTTGATNGQALVYNGSSWAPGTVSGGGSWTPTQLSSGFRIWDLDPGIYQMPTSGTFYYYGSSGSPTLSSTGGMLYIYSDNSIKCWYIITDYAGGGSNGAEAIISGWSSSSGGSYGMHYLSSSNNGSKYFGVHDYSTSTISTLNSADRPYTDNGVFCSQINSSTTAKPTNLTLSSATRMMMFVTRNYISGSYSGYNARQDLYVPSLNKHYYRYITFTTSSVTPITTTPNCDSSGWVEEIPIPSYTSSDAGKCLQVATGGASLQWATVSGGGGGGASYDFNNSSLTYSSTYTEQGLSVYYADCTSSKRNVMFLNIDSSAYTSYFSHDEALGIYLKTTDFTENYVFIYNTSGHDIIADYEMWNFITASDANEYASHLNQVDSSGNYITIPKNKTTMFGISRMQMNNEVFMVITYGGTFSYT